MLLAIGVVALLGLSLVPTEPAASVAFSAAGTELCLVAADQPDAGDSGWHWQADPHSVATASWCRWTSAPTHAALAAMPAPHIFETSRAPRPPDAPVRSLPRYLRHIPLLI